MKRQLVSVVGVEILDENLFHHFINHYDEHVDEFSIIFNYENINLLDFFYQMVPKNKRNIKFWNGKYDEHTKTKHINNLIDSEDRSSIIADHDEFIEFNEDFFKCPVNKYNMGTLVERFNVKNNKILLSKVKKNKSIFEQFNESSTLNISSGSFREFRALSKACYVHNNMHVFLGHHYLLNKEVKIHTKVIVHHFKYNSSFKKVVNNVMNLQMGFKHEIEKLNKIILDNSLKIY